MNCSIQQVLNTFIFELRIMFANRRLPSNLTISTQTHSESKPFGADMSQVRATNVLVQMT